MSDRSVSETSVLLFDLGAVVIDVDFGRVLRAWQPHSRLSPDELTSRFGFDPHYERHERGEIDASTYFDHLASSLDLSGSHAQIMEGWNAIFAGEITETLGLISKARLQFPCYAFSNTNATHQAVWSHRYPAVIASFDRIYTSHELGVRKPERQAFEAVAMAIGVAPQSILFFDDALSNVEGAVSSGMRAVQVLSPVDVRGALQKLGVAI